MKHFFQNKLSERALKCREKPLLDALDTILNRSRWSRDEILFWQEDMLKKIVKHAYESIPFYRRKYSEAGFHPDQIRHLDDLKTIPGLTKDELRNATKSDLTGIRNSENDLFLMTSGSTGKPVGLYKSQESLVYFTAYNTWLYYQWCGGSPLTQVLYFLDSKPHNIDYAIADHLRTCVMEDRIITTFDPIPVLCDHLNEFFPEFISTYPATLRNLSSYLISTGAVHDETRLIHLTSEMLDNHTRKITRQAFPSARIVETYTSTEAGLMGFECWKNGGFHLTEDSMIFEIMDEKGRESQDQGQLWVTDLVNFATPVIRYSGLGDIVKCSHNNCDCGSTFRRISSLEGRTVDSITMPDRTMRSPYVLTNILAEMHYITGFQIIQLQTDLFEIYLATQGSLQESETADQLSRAFSAALHHSVTCRIRCVDSIRPQPGQHKVPLVVSKIGGTP